MRNLKNYKQFNEGILSTLKGWYKDFMDAIKKGLIRKIPSGPRKGKPFAMMFLPENGKIVDQLKNYLNYTEPNKISTNEAAVPMESDKGKVNQTMTEFKQEIKDYYKIREQMAKGGEDAKGMDVKPIFVYGAPGIGKTFGVAECADDLEIPLIFLDVQYMNPEDFKGIPSQHEIRAPKISKNGDIEDPGAGFTRSNPPSVFPRGNGKNDRGGIMFLDELNRANESVLNSLMQFIQYGRIGEEYVLPNRWLIVAAGNRVEDDPNADIKELGTALTGRFSVSNLVPSQEEWEEWAKKEINIMPEMVFFLQHNKEFFHYNDPENADGGGYPTPRSWAQASKILLSRAKVNGKVDWRDLSQKFILNVFSKEIGPSVAGKFCEYLNILRDVTDEDINKMFRSPDTAPISSKIKGNGSLVYGLMAMVLNRVKSYNVTELANVMKYFNRYGQGEQLAWLFDQIRKKYPKFNHLTPDPNDTEADKKLKHDIAMMLTSNGKKSGII